MRPTYALPLCALLLWALPMTACGTNTDEPVYPVLLAFSPVGVPTLVSVTPVETQQPAESPQYQFDVAYYVTNREDSFIGYNLYVDSSATAAEAAVLGLTGRAYFEDGIAPSFKHSSTEASTLSTNLKTRRVKYFRSPPDLRLFQTCELYYFRLSAVTSQSLESLPSLQLERCAALNAALCPKGTPCNP